MEVTVLLRSLGPGYLLTILIKHSHSAALISAGIHDLDSARQTGPL
jgi:hypothetical protein